MRVQPQEQVPKEDEMQKLLAEFAALVVDGHSVDVSAAGHKLLDAGMSKEEIIRFELVLRDAAVEALREHREC